MEVTLFQVIFRMKTLYKMADCIVLHFNNVPRHMSNRKFFLNLIMIYISHNKCVNSE